jgi:uncharacterized membrane protein
MNISNKSTIILVIYNYYIIYNMYMLYNIYMMIIILVQSAEGQQQFMGYIESE